MTTNQKYTDPRKKIIDVFVERGKQLLGRTPCEGFEIVDGHDVHAFYKYKDGTVEHIQGYPGMSNQEVMRVSARLRDYKTMLEQRLSGTVSIGNEHEANIPGAFPHLQLLREVPYNVDKLNDLLMRVQ